jgi:hypothetical protein
MTDKSVDQYLADLAAKRAEGVTISHPDPRTIDAIMRDVLPELPVGTTIEQVPDTCVIWTGVMNTFAFDRAKLEAHRDTIKAMIATLPEEFLAEKGGGWSFLNLCTAKDGTLWTGMHMVCDHLIALAGGLKIAAFVMPRELWSALPGGMPYVQFTLEDRELASA